MNPFKEKQSIQTSEKKEPEQKPDVQAVQTKTENTPTVLLSKADAYIHERIKSQPKTREEIDIKVDDVFNPEQHRLTLPKELDDFRGRYAFRWIFKKEQAISEACDIKGWVLINRTHFPELPNHLFSVTGSIERGDMILAFMKSERAEMLRKDPITKSRDQVLSRINAHQGNPDFYVPTDKTEEGDSSKVIGL